MRVMVLVKATSDSEAGIMPSTNPMLGPSEIEIRPVFEMIDFGDALTPEVAKLHDRNREKVASR
jgi:hypothetical protein